MLLSVRVLLSVVVMPLSVRGPVLLSSRCSNESLLLENNSKRLLRKQPPSLSKKQNKSSAPSVTHQAFRRMSTQSTTGSPPHYPSSYEPSILRSFNHSSSKPSINQQSFLRAIHPSIQRAIHHPLFVIRDFNRLLIFGPSFASFESSVAVQPSVLIPFQFVRFVLFYPVPCSQTSGQLVLRGPQSLLWVSCRGK